MDPLTHSLSGLVLAQAGLRQRYGYQATLALAGGALLPDIDILWTPVGSVAALEAHRGITHSLVGAVALGLATGFLLRFLGPEKRWSLLSALCLFGLAAHLFLDLITSFGIQLFLPFSRARPALDLVFIIDPLLTLPLLAAFVTGLLWRRHAWLIGRLALAIAASYLTFMAVGHSAALAAMQRSLASQGVEVERVEVLPSPFAPLRWRGFAEDEKAYWLGDVQLTRAEMTLSPIVKGPDSALVARAREHGDVQTFLWFARFPVVSLLDDGGRYVLEYRDLRFALPLRRSAPFILRVILSPAGEVEEVLFNR